MSMVSYLLRFILQRHNIYQLIAAIYVFSRVIQISAAYLTMSCSFSQISTV